MKTKHRKSATPANSWWAYPYEEGDVVTDVPPTDHDVKRGWCRPVAMLTVTPEETKKIHQKIKVAIDVEDNTGSGCDWAAWRVMKRIGLTNLTWLRFYKTILITP